MTLFYAVSLWNSWFSAFLYLDQKELFPVTVYLRNLIASASNPAAGMAGADTVQIGANIQSVTMLLTVLPIVCFYPLHPEVLRVRRDARLRQGLTPPVPPATPRPPLTHPVERRRSSPEENP